MTDEILSVDDFRSRNPAFTASLYPDSQVEARLVLASKFFSLEGFPDEDLLRHVVALYVAHYLTIGGSTEANAMGGGANPNPFASKSVDGVSVSYDTSSAIETNAGFWNATAFGRELWQLMKIFGAGARQI